MLFSTFIPQWWPNQQNHHHQETHSHTVITHANILLKRKKLSEKCNRWWNQHPRCNTLPKLQTTPGFCQFGVKTIYYLLHVMHPTVHTPLSFCRTSYSALRNVDSKGIYISSVSCVVSLNYWSKGKSSKQIRAMWQEWSYSDWQHIFGGREEGTAGHIDNLLLNIYLEEHEA